MGDLFDEIGKSSSDNVASKVGALGGDLLDEAGVKEKDPERFSGGFSSRQVDSQEGQALLDELNAELDAFDRFLVGAGRGMMTIARGTGAVDQEERIIMRAFKGLAEESVAAQAGEIIGECAPFLAAAPVTPTAIGTRVALGVTLGATEGGLIARGKGGTAAETATGAGVGGVIGGGVEALFPVLGRLGRQVFKRLGRAPKGPLLTSSGGPTPELQKALDETGTSFADLTDEAVDMLGRQEREIGRASCRERV